MYYEDIETAVGPLRVGVNEEGRLRRASFLHGEHKHDVTRDWAGAVRDGRAGAVAAQLREYFAGERREFDLPLGLEGSEFQRKVWRALLEVPYGETASYGDIARRIGVAGRARAVGSANGSNPIPVVVPCHRIIGSNGALVGYGGGLHIKRFLLELEGALPAELFPRPDEQLRVRGEDRPEPGDAFSRRC